MFLMFVSDQQLLLHSLKSNPLNSFCEALSFETVITEEKDGLVNADILIPQFLIIVYIV